MTFPRPERGHPNGVQLGGIGTGRIELGRTGRITLAGITNNWQRLLAGLDGTFFCVRVARGGQAVFRLLQTEALDGAAGVAGVQYAGRHPVASVAYRDPALGVDVDLTAFSPLIPHDAARSMVPGAHFAMELRNTGPAPCRVRLAFSCEHLIGCGGHGYRGWSLASDRSGNVIRPWQGRGGRGLRFTGGSPAQAPSTQGELLLAVGGVPGARIWAYSFWNILRHRPAVLAALADGREPAEFDAGALDDLQAAWERRQAGPPPSWDDPDPRFGGGRSGIEGAIHPAGVLGAELDLAPGARVCVPFALAWYTAVHQASGQPGIDHGHGYQARYAGVAEVAEDLLANGPALLEETRATARHLDGGTLPRWLCDKVLNDQTAVTTNSIVTRAGVLYTLEASPMMFGALGTLDQRLIAHPGTSLLWPGLNRTELATFARLQAPDGSLPHFNGNAHEALGDAGVAYGTTHWPDLACSFIIQVYRDWTETGDTAAFERLWPHALRAFEWLLAADRDGDGVPEGGSSWDIEHYPGCFIATGTLWLATLRVASAIAERRGDHGLGARAAEGLAAAAATVEAMWCGSYYRKFHDRRTGEGSDDLFIGQLEGEWVVRQLGLPPVLRPERVAEAVRTLYRHAGDTSRFQLMPNQLQRDGGVLPRKYAWHAWPQYAMVFLDCVALYAGAGERALASLAQFDRVVREVNGMPWATTLWYDARTGAPDFEDFVGVDWYMNTPAAWFVLSALSGFQPDETAGRVTMGPALPAGPAVARYPVVTPRYWAYLDVSRSGEGLRVVFTPVRVFDGGEVHIHTVHWRGALTAARVLAPGPGACAVTARGIYTDLALPAPVTLAAAVPLVLAVSP